jgi:hypothetical protein
MLSPLRRPWTVVICLLAFTLLTLMSYAQNVTTWHNDNSRTGWQQNEPVLRPATVNQNSFGLLCAASARRADACLSSKGQNESRNR